MQLLSMDAVNAERSKLVQRHKQEKQELEKKVKKSKGAMKEAAAKELEELEERQEAELKTFEQNKGGGGGASKTAPKEEAKEPTESAKDLLKKFRDRNWSSLSKKELEEACAERGLGKKGGKEDLIQKLIIFQQDLASKAAAEGPDEPAEDRTSAAKTAKAAADSEDDEDSEEDEDDEEDDDDDDDEEEVDREVAEKQARIEKHVQKAVQCVLTDHCPEGFALDDLCTKLEMVKVKGFAPEKCGYKTLEKFAKGQPRKVLRYDKKTQMILPPTGAKGGSAAASSA